MRKSIIIAAISAASAILLAASCQKQEAPESRNESKTFTAVIDQELTKTTITSEFKVNWDEGDQIDINGAIYSATPNSSDATKAGFTKVSGSDPTPDYTAVYPASIIVNTAPTLPATQTYAAGKFGAPMCAMSDEETLEFKNFCGVICFALKGTDKVRSIAVTANEQLCGPFEFMDATAFCFTGENEGYTVTLDCGTEGVQLNETTATNFYIYLPPCTYTAGMKMTVTNTDGQTFEKTTTKSAEIVRSNIYTFNWTPTFDPALPDDALAGVFSVSETKKVHFSKGNLQATYDGTGYTWGFAANQYSFIGNAPGNDNIRWQSSGAVVDLFGWSTASTDHGINTSTTNSDYSGDFVDWGKEIGDGNTWRTLTTEEWQYLFNNHTNGWSTVDGVGGYIIAPDGFDGTIAASYANDAELAADKLVFLPAAGYRSASFIFDVDSNGYYWSSSVFDEEFAYFVFLRSFYASPDVSVDRFRGYSVRLVTDVK